jgi:hypothetical protein
LCDSFQCMLGMRIRIVNQNNDSSPLLMVNLASNDHPMWLTFCQFQLDFLLVIEK